MQEVGGIYLIVNFLWYKFLIKWKSAASSTALNQTTSSTISKTPHYLYFTDDWPLNEKEKILNDFIVIPNFVSEGEEQALIEEVDPYMKRLKYEFDHWDDVTYNIKIRYRNL